MVPLAVDIDTARRGSLRDRDDDGEVRLLDDLSRELDRCDRYHNVCGLVLLHVHADEDHARALLLRAARQLGDTLRTSDRVYCLPAGELAVVVPENVQQLDRLQARLVAQLRQFADDPTLAVDAARVAYPASKGPAEVLLARVRERLAPVARDDAASR